MFTLKESVILGALMALSCGIHDSRRPTGEQQQPRDSIKSAATPPDVVANSQSNIRSVDFDNIAYPNLPDYSDDREKRRKDLKPGEGKPHQLIFGDVNNDGKDDAMAVVGIDSRGSAIPEYVYIFTLENGKLKLLWDFETGDRADGGLKQIYADHGDLVIELEGKDRVIGENLYKGDAPLCCPDWYTRSVYRWDGRRFHIVERQTLPEHSK